jgi:hypothetical protein
VRVTERPRKRGTDAVRRRLVAQLDDEIGHACSAQTQPKHADEEGDRNRRIDDRAVVLELIEGRADRYAGVAHETQHGNRARGGRSPGDGGEHSPSRPSGRAPAKDQHRKDHNGEDCRQSISDVVRDRVQLAHDVAADSEEVRRAYQRPLESRADPAVRVDDELVRDQRQEQTEQEDVQVITDRCVQPHHVAGEVDDTRDRHQRSDQVLGTTNPGDRARTDERPADRHVDHQLRRVERSDRARQPDGGQTKRCADDDERRPKRTDRYRVASKASSAAHENSSFARKR